MDKPGKPISVLMADDDPDDRMMVQEALEEAGLAHDLYFVEDGEELIEYLNRTGRYADRSSAPRPNLILLDLNMPKKDGREALREIKADAGLRRIPVVVLTTSKAEEDVVRTYELGVSSFVVKPVTFDSLVEVMKTLARYWFELVRLPEHDDEIA